MLAKHGLSHPKGSIILKNTYLSHAKGGIMARKKNVSSLKKAVEHLLNIHLQAFVNITISKNKFSTQ